MWDPIPCLLLALLPSTLAHVALTFPEARFPPLDFLDTSRTMGPCGVPRPRIPNYTNLVVGNTYNFTWRMQYPHQGGYRITLLDSNGKLVEQLAPMNGIEYAGTGDQTAQSERIRFTRTCSECTVVLERQALEWGKSYQFRSCSDVNILQTSSEDCNGRGLLEGGQCRCDQGFTGDVCQYIADCQSDNDCMNGGKCNLEGNSLVSKTCYCSHGFFGKNCDQNANRENDKCFAYSQRDASKFDKYGLFNEDCYNKDDLNDQDKVYYRKVKNDVEIILDFASTSWVSLGWRPDGLDPSCRLFPDLEGVTGVRVKRSSGEDDSRSISNEDLIPSSTSIRRDQPPVRVAQEGPRPEMPKNNGLLTSALEAPLHAMDCIDVIVGSVKDGRLRILDMYSRDRSTPLEDHWYEGEMSLSAAYGAEQDGRTVVMFRRMIQEIEPTDHPLGPGRMFVVWAKGQVQGSYKHSTSSGLDGAHSDEQFYADDVLKYHGSKNRGVHPIDFTIPTKLAKPDEAAFGVHTAHLANSKVRFSTPAETTTSSSSSTTSTTSPPDEPDTCNTLTSLSLLVVIMVYNLII